jgi:hypothetical protein
MSLRVPGSEPFVPNFRNGVKRRHQRIPCRVPSLANGRPKYFAIGATENTNRLHKPIQSTISIASVAIGRSRRIASSVKPSASRC